jgi:HlyD family secretion protein
MKRAITIFLILATVIGLSLVSYAAFAGEKKPDISQLETITVERGMIMNAVNATGSIAPKAEVALTFKSGGKLETIAVRRGQAVRAGELLASLETADLELEWERARANLALSEAQLAKVKRKPSTGKLAAAEANLVSAQAAYNKVIAGPTEEELTAAEANLASAWAAYQKAKEGPDENDIAIAQVDLERARIKLEKAQSRYDQVAWVGGIQALSPSLDLQQATFDYEAAQARYNQAVEGPTEADIKAAEAKLAQAQSDLEEWRKKPTLEDIKAAEAKLAQALDDLEDLKEQPRPEDVAEAQARVDDARAAVKQVELRLEGLTIVAPFDGEVSRVHVEINEQVSAGTTIVELVNNSAFHIDVEVDEIDIGQVAVGQPVFITLDALPDKEIAGHIEAIAPTASTAEGGGVVAYVVTIAIEPGDAPLRAGMSADAAITTDRRDNVLIIPNRVIQIDRDRNKMYVEKLLEDGEIARVEIQTGMRNEQYSEVVAGLEEGDKIVLRGISGSERLRRAISSGPSESPH